MGGFSKNSQGVQLQTKVGPAADHGGSDKVLPKVKANGMPTFMSYWVLIRQNKQC